MSIFSAPTFYSQPDRQAYGAGNFFLPQEQYTFGGAPRILIPSGVTATTAAKSMLPFILPINQGGGDDRDRFDTPVDTPVDTSGFDYETDAYGLENKSAFDKGLTDEEQEALDNFRNPGLTKSQLAQLGLGFFSGMPLFTIANAVRMRKQNEEKALKQAQEATAQADFDRVMSQGNNQQDFYDSLNEGRGSTAVSGNPNTSGAGDAPGYAGPTPFAQGGLVDLVDIYD